MKISDSPSVHYLACHSVDNDLNNSVHDYVYKQVFSSMISTTWRAVYVGVMMAVENSVRDFMLRYEYP